jgi:hypothetical protein
MADTLTGCCDMVRHAVMWSICLKNECKQEKEKQKEKKKRRKAEAEGAPSQSYDGVDVTKANTCLADASWWKAWKVEGREKTGRNVGRMKKKERKKREVGGGYLYPRSTLYLVPRISREFMETTVSFASFAQKLLSLKVERTLFMIILTAFESRQTL